MPIDDIPTRPGLVRASWDATLSTQSGRTLEGAIAGVTLQHIVGAHGQCSDLYELRGTAVVVVDESEMRGITVEFVAFMPQRPSEGLSIPVLPVKETQYGDVAVTPVLTVPDPSAVYMDGQLKVEVWDQDAVRLRIEDTSECIRLDGAWDCSPTTLTLALDRTDDSDGRPLLTSEAYIEMCAVPGTELAEGFVDWDGVPVCEFESCL